MAEGSGTVVRNPRTAVRRCCGVRRNGPASDEGRMTGVRLQKVNFLKKAKEKIFLTEGQERTDFLYGTPPMNGNLQGGQE